MHVITRKRLNEFAEKYPDTKSSLTHWYAIMRKGRFVNFAQCGKRFRTLITLGSSPCLISAVTKFD